MPIGVGEPRGGGADETLYPGGPSGGGGGSGATGGGALARPVECGATPVPAAISNSMRCAQM
jgi:hypothetical protein